MTNIMIPIGKNDKPIYSDLASYNKMINTDPDKSWVMINQGVNYLPIRIIEELLRQVFPFHQIEQHGQPQILGNSIVVSIHLKVYNPILNDWLTYAGVGAVPIQLKSGSNPLDFDKINRTALHKNVPSAMSFAVNNAAKKIGRLFGSHVNSDETIYSEKKK